MHSYTDMNGEKHSITDEELGVAVDTKIQLQKSTNGTCNWNKLCSMLREQGIDAKRCENFRVLVREYQRAIGKLKPVAKYAEMVSNNRLKAIDNEIGELNLQKREIQNYKRDFGKLRRYVTDTQLHRKQLYDIARKNININVTHREHDDFKPQLHSHSLIVTLTDLHVGAVTNLPNSKYNSKLAYTYLLEYEKKIVDMIDRDKPRAVYIANLGDMIEGSYMRYNQSFDIDLSQSEQQSTAIEYITSFLSSIYEHTSNRGIKLYYTGIAGNHDRSKGNKKDVLQGDSFITVLNTIVKLMSERLDDFEFLEPDTQIRTKLNVENHWIKLVHGDHDNLNKNDVLSNHSQLDKLHYDAILGGHKHSLMIKENNGLIIQSGSIVGNTNYSDDLAVSASRSQLILRVENNGFTPIPIQLNIQRLNKLDK